MRNFNHLSGEYLHLENDADIYFEVIGKEDAPVLLVLHGGFGTMEDFNNLADDLCDDFKIIGIDSRGHGKSSLGSKTLTYAQIQDDAEKILDRLNISTLSLLGFSDGGIVAYRLAALSSLKIEKLVTVGSRWHIKDALLTKDLFLKVTPLSWKNKFPDTYNKYQKLNPEPDFESLTTSIVKMWLDADLSGYLNDKITGVTCPLLIVRGDGDHLLSKGSVVELSELIRGSSLLNIPFAGHTAYLEQREIFMLIFNQFMKKI
jgi:pimeloyl-ACP methyl ester carboxylesterase